MRPAEQHRQRLRLSRPSLRVLRLRKNRPGFEKTNRRRPLPHIVRRHRQQPRHQTRAQMRMVFTQWILQRQRRAATPVETKPVVKLPRGNELDRPRLVKPESRQLRLQDKRKIITRIIRPRQRKMRHRPRRNAIQTSHPRDFFDQIDRPLQVLTIRWHLPDAGPSRGRRSGTTQPKTPQNHGDVVIRNGRPQQPPRMVPG